MDAWFYGHMAHWMRMEMLEQEGVLASGSTEASMRAGLRIYFSNPFAKRWWQLERGNEYYKADFRRIVDTVISELSADFGRQLLEGLQPGPAHP